MPKINQSIETEVFDEHGNMVSKERIRRFLGVLNRLT